MDVPPEVRSVVNELVNKVVRKDSNRRYREKNKEKILAKRKDYHKTAAGKAANKRGHEKMRKDPVKRAKHNEKNREMMNRQRASGFNASGKVQANMCISCANKRISVKAYRTDRLCADCRKAAPTRTEHYIIEKFEKAFGDLWNLRTSTDQSVSNSVNCPNISRRRPDVSFVTPDGLIVTIEVDENSHDERDPSCEISKLQDELAALTTQLSHYGKSPKQMITFRLNPNACDRGTILLDKRIQCVVDNVTRLLNDSRFGNTLFSDFDASHPCVAFIAYHTKGNYLIEAQKQAFGDNNVIVLL